MQEGAFGVSSALIYAPGSYARADELTALAEVAGQYGGLYISHIRSEGDRLLEALDELIATARKANVAAEMYHMKAAGKSNWDKCDAMIQKIEKARAEGLRITADMYTYTAGATGLDAAMPPWVQEGGQRAWVTRLRDPALRQRVVTEMTTPADGWENFYLLAGAPENILLVGFKNDKLKPLIGKTLAEVATLRGKSPPETAIDLVIEDDSRVNTVYFLMSEENVKKQIQCPWVSFCSDAGSLAPEGVFLKSSTHPRAYGNFARLLGKYVRDEKVIPLEEAIRRLTSLPAQNLKLDRAGPTGEGLLRRHRRLRSGDHHRPRDLREPAPVRHGRDPRLRQRRPGAQRRRAHRRQAGPGRPRPRLEGQGLKSEIVGWGLTHRDSASFLRVTNMIPSPSRVMK